MVLEVYFSRQPHKSCCQGELLLCVGFPLELRRDLVLLTTMEMEEVAVRVVVPQVRRPITFFKS